MWAETRKGNIVRHKKKCCVETLYCTNFNKFATCQADFNYHTAKNHPRMREKNTYECKICLEKISSSYALQHNRSIQHGVPIRTSNPDIDTPREDIDDVELKKQFFCNHFFVVSELEKERHCLFIFATSSFKSYSSTQKCIMCLMNWNVPSNSTLRSDLYWKTLKMERKDTFTHTKTIRFWRGLNLRVRKRTWLTWKRNCRKWVLVIIALYKERSVIKNLQTYKCYGFCSVPQW